MASPTIAWMEVLALNQCRRGWRVYHQEIRPSRMTRSPTSSSFIDPAPASARHPRHRLRRIKLSALFAAARPEIPAGGAIINGVLTITSALPPRTASRSFSTRAARIFPSLRTQRHPGFPLSSVTGISIDAGGGNDAIALVKGNGTRAVQSTITVAGGNGNDVIVGGARNRFSGWWEWKRQALWRRAGGRLPRRRKRQADLHARWRGLYLRRTGQ